MIPSYTTLISGIVTRLKQDATLTEVAEDNIYFGNELQIPQFPAITVELTEADEDWKTFPKGKDLHVVVTVRVFDEAMDYQTGLQSVEKIVRKVDSIFHSDIKISGLAYNSEVSRKRFAIYDFDNVPVMGCELELHTLSRFSPT